MENQFLNYSLREFQKNEDINPINEWINTIPKDVEKLKEWKKKYHYVWIEIQRVETRKIIKEIEETKDMLLKLEFTKAYLGKSNPVDVGLLGNIDVTKQKIQILWDSIPREAMNYAKRYVSLQAGGKYDIECVN